MMDEFENNRENEHVDQTPHAETPYDTGDGNTDNLKRTEQQTEQNAEHRLQLLKLIFTFLALQEIIGKIPRRTKENTDQYSQT